MKNSNQSDQIKVLEAKIDRLQRSITKLEKKLTDHIAFIDRVYEPLRNPISKIKNFFGLIIQTRHHDGFFCKSIIFSCHNFFC